ncbi:FtsJ-like methyltransferase [Nitzschia inconspicua]|uniref:Cap-specific mRNA (nucleoside-2'-O-)-methyltransferase 1 n=1 Tax=Nitzschia inconspicua TaxID=303405 RepID=A0A9K3M069_9STRA|nr:FtsJ-like methyltransferase [Nitzschia inconspicua]
MDWDDMSRDEPSPKNHAVKRLRRDETPIFTNGPTTTDNYQELIYTISGDGGSRNTNSFDISTALPNEWLLHQHNECKSPSNDVPLTITSATTNTTNKTSSTTTEQRQMLHMELESLKQQLAQVKRRLEPAREACAAAVNAKNQQRDGNHSKQKTTPEQEFCTARSQANPMECLGTKYGLNHKLFLNRSAIKLANLDAILEFSLTANTKTTTTATATNGDTTTAAATNVFLFADLCGAPGGFSEYLMKRCQQRHQPCRGYGVSLLGTNEHGQGCNWKLDACLQQPGNEKVIGSSYWISKGADGTGDVYKWDNIIQFQMEIQQDLAQAGLPLQKMDLVVADGGFDAQRGSECQEEVSQKLVLCELAAALELLKEGGMLIIKLFGCQTESIRRSMRFMYDHFEWIQEIKPVSSRPASQERYALFWGFKGLPLTWRGGPSWIGSVLIGSEHLLQADKSVYQDLDDYIDTVDRDLMRLNLKACFAILSNLERKTASLVESSECPHVQGVERWHRNSKQEQRLIKMYRHAWNLHGLQTR